MEIINISPRDCTRWKYADRSFFEFGDLSALTESIKLHGQIEPIYVRELSNNSEFKYEVLAGSRRWKACLSENITLKAIVKNVSDEEAAIIQIKENEKVEISDYSKGIVFSKLQKDNKLTQEQLSDIVGCSRRKIQNLLCFDKVHPDIWKAVSNMSKVSAKSAETIMHIANKSERHKAALIEIAEDIRKGAGDRRIAQLVDKILLGDKFEDLTGDLIQSDSGQVFATWKNGAIIFSKNLNIDKKALNEYLIKFFTSKTH